MEENYGMMDLVFSSIPQHPHPPPHDLHHAMVMLGGGGVNPFGSDSTMGMASSTSGLSGGDSGSGSAGGGGLNIEIGGRWTKEETLALLDIRASLDSKFKEANHKGHLWDEVSMLMCTEHGYKRSGKKCSDKFENLIKYYKKIREGKAGRQDKKHYRFFHQLEALSGETSTNTNPIAVANAALSPPFVEDNYVHVQKTNNKIMLEKKHWKTKLAITNSIEKKMNALMEKQDRWMEKVMNAIEEKENERILKEKQWRREEAARLEREQEFRSKERARMEYRHAALMEALQKLTKNESTINDQQRMVANWGENETTHLIQVRSSMETRFGKLGGFMEDVLWEEIAMTMSSLGYNRSAQMCKAKWDDHISSTTFDQLRNKKQKGSSCSNVNYDHHHNDHMFHDQGGDQQRFVTINDQHDNRGGGNMVFMGGNELMWDYYRKIKET